MLTLDRVEGAAWNQRTTGVLVDVIEAWAVLDGAVEDSCEKVPGEGDCGRRGWNVEGRRLKIFDEGWLERFNCRRDGVRRGIDESAIH